MDTDRCGNSSGQKCHAKRNRKRTKIKVFMQTYKANVEYDMCDYTGNIRSHCNSNKRFSETFESHNKKTFIDLLGTSHIIRKVLQSRNLKPERWGSPLVQ